MWDSKLKFPLLLLPAIVNCVGPQCEPIRIEMCFNIGYNSTAMPNLVGHELQTDVELTLQTFAPLIEYVCSTQLKLFLCAAYVPMCTPKVPLPIGPCRNLCESVRSRCHPVLQGFGFPWPPALDCIRFPKENNHETMCMEGPREANTINDNDIYPGLATRIDGQEPPLNCPEFYVTLHRSGRCAPLCEADILFGWNEKHLADMWVATWNYAALGLAVFAALSLIFNDYCKNNSKWVRMLVPLVSCHIMVVIGWTVRFIFGRTTTACGYDPQLLNVLLLLVDGLSNPACAANFLLRYYFGMAAYAWWALLCLGWNRGVRSGDKDVVYSRAVHGKPNRKLGEANRNYDIIQSNFARFIAWGLPGFQTAAVIVARLVDADELLGACYVGNQSDKGLQILVATPLFCYWIVGTMNLISGYLVHRRNKEVSRDENSESVQHSKGVNSNIGIFLFIYCILCALLLFGVIYEFANIDVWLNMSSMGEDFIAPMWPFMLRVFMELMLGITCFAWVLGPKITSLYKRQFTHVKPTPVTARQNFQLRHASNTAYTTVSYHTVRYPPVQLATSPVGHSRNYSMNTSQYFYPPNHSNYNSEQQFSRYSNETIL